MEQENRRAAQKAHENVDRPAEDYDDGARPAAARARDTDPPRGPRPQGADDDADEEQAGN